jgi:hypothetical protein
VTKALAGSTVGRLLLTLPPGAAWVCGSARSVSGAAAPGRCLTPRPPTPNPHPAPHFQAFQKIIKKHDKASASMVWPFYQAHLHRQRWHTEGYTALWDGLAQAYSRLHAEAGQPGSQPGLPLAPEAGRCGSVAAAHTTIKFWVREADTAAVKHLVLEHLPVRSLRAGSGGGAPPASSAASSGGQFVHHSVYCDNASLELYHNRLYGARNSLTVKLSWADAGVGQEQAAAQAAPRLVAVERKLRPNGWRSEVGLPQLPPLVPSAQSAMSQQAAARPPPLSPPPPRTAHGSPPLVQANVKERVTVSGEHLDQLLDGAYTAQQAWLDCRQLQGEQQLAAAGASASASASASTQAAGSLRAAAAAAAAAATPPPAPPAPAPPALVQQQPRRPPAHLPGTGPPLPPAHFTALFNEVQHLLDIKQLRPRVYSSCSRTVFQMPFEDSLRITLDTDISISSGGAQYSYRRRPRKAKLDGARQQQQQQQQQQQHELEHAPSSSTAAAAAAAGLPGSSPEQQQQQRDVCLEPLVQGDTQEQQGRDQQQGGAAPVYHLPYNILKVNLAEGELLPSWLAGLVQAGLLQEAEDWSRFVHGCAVLAPEVVRAVPFWVDDPQVGGRRWPAWRRSRRMRAPVSHHLRQAHACASLRLLPPPCKGRATRGSRRGSAGAAAQTNANQGEGGAGRKGEPWSAGPLGRPCTRHKHTHLEAPDRDCSSSWQLTRPCPAALVAQVARSMGAFSRQQQQQLEEGWMLGGAQQGQQWEARGHARQEVREAGESDSAQPLLPSSPSSQRKEVGGMVVGRGDLNIFCASARLHAHTPVQRAAAARWARRRPPQ